MQPRSFPSRQPALAAADLWSPPLRSAFTSGRLGARKARVKKVEGKTLTLSDGSTIEVGGRAGVGHAAASCAVQCQHFGVLPCPINIAMLSGRITSNSAYNLCDAILMFC